MNSWEKRRPRTSGENADKGGILKNKLINNTVRLFRRMGNINRGRSHKGHGFTSPKTAHFRENFQEHQSNTKQQEKDEKIRRRFSDKLKI